MLRSILLVLMMASLTAGCAIGRKQDFLSAQVDVSATSKIISVAVLDHRPYVLDKTKVETFTGLSRSGAGIPYNMHTGSGQPLASDMAAVLANSLRTKGATVSVVAVPPPTSESEAMAKVATPGGKGLLIELLEWKSDTYLNTSLLFNLQAFVVDPAGRSIGESHVAGEDKLDYQGLNTRDTAPIAAFGKKMHELLAAPAVASQL